METKSIMIVGVGGQGTLLTSRILGGITTHAGYDVKLSEVHGMAQRGGSVVTFVRYGEKVNEPIVEEGCADVLIAFERLEALRYAHFLKPDGVLIVNDQRIDPMTVVTGAAEYPEGIIEGLSKRIQSDFLRCHGRSKETRKSESFQYDYCRSCGKAYGFCKGRLAYGNRENGSSQRRLISTKSFRSRIRLLTRR